MLHSMNSTLGSANTVSSVLSTSRRTSAADMPEDLRLTIARSSSPASPPRSAGPGMSMVATYVPWRGTVRTTPLWASRWSARSTVLGFEPSSPASVRTEGSLPPTG